MLLDIFSAVIILFFLIRGALKGLLREVFWLAGVIVAGFTAVLLFREGGAWLAGITGLSPRLANVTAFLLLFLVIVFVFLFVGRMIQSLAAKMHLSAVNRVFGGLFGGLKGVLIAGVILFAIRGVLEEMGRSAYLHNTILAERVMGFAMNFVGFIRPVID